MVTNKKTPSKKPSTKKASVKKKSPTNLAVTSIERLRAVASAQSIAIDMLEVALGIPPRKAEVVDESACVVCLRDRGKSMGFCADCQTDYNAARKACKDEYWTMLSWAAGRARQFARKGA